MEVFEYIEELLPSYVKSDDQIVRTFGLETN